MRPVSDSCIVELLDDQMVEILRAKTPAERVEMIFAANRTARLLAAAGVRYEHPDWDEIQVQAAVVKRIASEAVRFIEAGR